MGKVKISPELFGEILVILAAADADLYKRVLADTLAPTKAGGRKKEREDGLTGEDLEYFNMAWDSWPKTVRGKWLPGEGWEMKPVLKGSKAVAERNFKAMLPRASSQELYAAAVAYLNEADSVKSGFVQNVSTFYGPVKATALEWIERGRQLINQQS